MCRNDFVDKGSFLCFNSFCITMFSLVCVYIFIKKNSVKCIYFNGLFNCFGLVGRLEFHICADKTPNRQYFLGDMTRCQASLFNKFFQAQTNTIYKTQFIKVFPKKT